MTDQNGSPIELELVRLTGISVATQRMMTRDEWLRRCGRDVLHAAEVVSDQSAALVIADALGWTRDGDRS